MTDSLVFLLALVDFGAGVTVLASALVAALSWLDR